MTTSERMMDRGGDQPEAQARSIGVWDLPTRVLHWLLVIFMALCWWTAKHRENFDYHVYSGYAVLWVALLRIYWGVVGSSTARFANFVRGPRAVAAYARELHKRATPHMQGHNPLGAISVVLLLAFVLIDVSLGLFSVDVDGLNSGPLSSWVSFETGRHLAKLHYRFFNYLLALICLHVAAVGFYFLYKRQNLVFPMITGRRNADDAQGELRPAPIWRLAAGAALVSLLVWLISKALIF